MDTLLATTDVEEALSEAYAFAVAAKAGYVVSRKNFDRDGVDLTFEAGGNFRPKIDAQLKATINLPIKDGLCRYPCNVNNYELLRIDTQTPRILIVLHLPRNPEDWLAISRANLVLRNCAYWAYLRGMPETKNAETVTVSLLTANRFNVEGLTDLMERSRTGAI